MWDWFLGWSKFPTDKTCGRTIFSRYSVIFLLLAAPVTVLNLPHEPQLIAGWAIFWYGVFRYWLRDVRLDESEIARMYAQMPLWCLSIAHLLLILPGLALITEQLAGARFPFQGLMAEGVFLGFNLAASVSMRNLHRHRRELRTAHRELGAASRADVNQTAR